MADLIPHRRSAGRRARGFDHSTQLYELGTYGIGERGALEAMEASAGAIPGALSVRDGRLLFIPIRVVSLIRPK